MNRILERIENFASIRKLRIVEEKIKHFCPVAYTLSLVDVVEFHQHELDRIRLLVDGNAEIDAVEQAAHS